MGDGKVDSGDYFGLEYVIREEVKGVSSFKRRVWWRARGSLCFYIFGDLFSRLLLSV